MLHADFNEVLDNLASWRPESMMNQTWKALSAVQNESLKQLI